MPLLDLLYVSFNQLVDALTGLERILSTRIPISCMFTSVSLYEVLIPPLVTLRTCGWLLWFIVQRWYAHMFVQPAGSTEESCTYEGSAIASTRNQSNQRPNLTAQK